MSIGFHLQLSIECKDTASTIGSDHLRVLVTTDGNKNTMVYGNLNSGDKTWKVGSGWDYDALVSIRLYDKSTGWIRTIGWCDFESKPQTGSGGVPTKNFSWTGHGSLYYVGCTITQIIRPPPTTSAAAATWTAPALVPAPALSPGHLPKTGATPPDFPLLYILSPVLQRQRAIDSVNSWAFGRGAPVRHPSPWQFNVAAVAQGIIARIVNPFLVSQKFTPLCGPAAIVFECARRDPLSYAKFCMSTYDSGGFTTLDPAEHYHAGEGVINLPVPTANQYSAVMGGMFSSPNDDIAVVDWMMLLTVLGGVVVITEDLTGTNPYGNSYPSFADTTSPEDIQDMAWCILGTDLDEHSVWGAKKGQEIYDGALTLVERRQPAFLQVSSEMFGISNDNWFGYPNHWVSLVGGEFLGSLAQAKTTEIDLYTWGYDFGSKSQIIYGFATVLYMDHNVIANNVKSAVYFDTEAF